MPIESGSAKANTVTTGQKRKFDNKKSNSKPDKNNDKKPKTNKLYWSYGLGWSLGQGLS